MDYKLSGIGFIGVLSSVIAGYFFSSFALLDDYTGLVVACVFALIYLTSAALRVLTIEEKWQAATLIALDMVVFSASFTSAFSIWFVLALAVGGTWLFAAWKNGRRATGNMLKVRLRDLGHAFVRPALHAMLFLAIATYLSLVNPKTITVPRALVAESVRSVMDKIGTDIVAKITETDLSAEQSESLIDKVITAMHKAANGVVQQVPEEARAPLLIGVGIMAFLLVNSVTGFLIPIITLFLWVAVRLLLRIGFISIRTEKAEKETIIA